MDKSIDKLKYFLKEMFQFNENDLDFGIYKIYNLKREHIQKFIDGDDKNDLGPIIDSILKSVKLESQITDSIELSNFLKGYNQGQLLEDAEKNYNKIKSIINFEDDAAQKVVLTDTLNNLLKASDITDELKDKIYNHILGFFQMYYSNGDFGYNDRSRDVYSVPYEANYNGSDTMFHWKHKGSLYIKTGTSFNAIKFDLNGKKIEYRLETNENSEEEGTSQNNNKDSQLKHYRLDRIEKKDGIYQVIFNLSDSSTSKVEIFKEINEIVFGNESIESYLSYTETNKKGEDVNKTVFVDLTKDFDKVQNGQINGLSKLRKTKKYIATNAKKSLANGEKLYDNSKNIFLDTTLDTLYSLDQKLNSFYIGNDADYFIHDNLKEFLTGEKERFVKNYIFDDLESIYSGNLDNTTLVIAKAFDKVSSEIIEFLSVIEDFQKHIFTKKKKVVESEYCITLDYIDEKYYEDILKNKLQLLEWENLFKLKIKNKKDLKNNQTLVVDTKFFQEQNGSNQFKDKILADIDDLDNKTDGLLFNSENYQMLELLQMKFKDKIKTIYIDPPYNTKSSPILYKNNFKHSSWISLIYDRLILGKNLLNKTNGVHITAIDDAEMLNLYSIIKSIFKEYRTTNVTVVHNPRGNITTDFNRVHEYALFSTPKDNKEVIKRTLEKNDSPRKMRRWGENSLRSERRLSFYPIYVKDGKISRIGDVPKDTFQPSGRNEILNTGETAIYPIDQNGIERRWNFGLDTIEDNLDRILIKEADGSLDLFLTHEHSVPKTVWKGGQYDAGKYGNTLLIDMFGKKLFDFPKSIHLVERSLDITSSENSVVVDYFAGSGTTGHAVISLNKSNKDLKMKYILNEMGIYFHHITKPRIQKAIYSDNWDKGIPLDNNGSEKQIFKYQTLEQYEDILDNLVAYKEKLPQDLPLKYLYKPEENSLDNTLNLFKPFTNKISYGQPTQNGYIDLIETYNYLFGYFVQSIKTYDLNSKYYKVVETTTGTLVIWRDIEVDEDDSVAIAEIVEEYSDIYTIEVNAEFATLNLDKSNNLKVKDQDIELKIINKSFFNQ